VRTDFSFGAGKVLMWRATMHGPFRTALNGTLVTQFVLDRSMWITRTIWKNT